MKVVFFAPHSAIWVHAFPEALVAEALQQSGHEVVYVGCGHTLQDQCVAMSAAGLDIGSSLAQRQMVCKRCDAQKSMLRNRLGLRGYDLADILEPADHLRLEEVLADATPKNYLEISIEGVPVGRYALYELLLHRKKLDLSLDANEWREYRAALKGSVAAVLAGRRILDREQPQRVFVYNALYAVNHVFCALARSRGIEQYFLHAGGNLSARLQTLMLGKDFTFPYLKRMVEIWPNFRDRPCPSDLMKQITEHFLVLFGGSSVFGYSARSGTENLNIRERFGVQPHQQILVAAMSSPDERFAAESVDALERPQDILFPQQVDWIDALLRLVRTREDLFLIIRVHPREFPNKRETVKSRHAELLEERFATLPTNARVNWPSEEISLYQLANETAVFLNAWSSAGKEMALLGLPVVAYSQELMFYPADLNYMGTTETEYFQTIDRALSDGWSIERSRMTYRWLALEYGYGLVGIEDSYKELERPTRKLAVKVARRLRQMVDPLFAQRRDCSARAPTLSSRDLIDRIVRIGAATPADALVSGDVPRSAGDVEEVALRAELARLGKALFGESSNAVVGSLASNLSRAAPSGRPA